MKNRSSYAVLTRFGIIAAILATLVLIAPVVSATDPLEFSYDENGKDPVETFTANDPDADAGDIEWDLEGVDAPDFDIKGGVLTFKKSPNYEGATDRDEDPKTSVLEGAGDNKYQVTILASGGKLAVEVEVINIDEPGSVKFTQLQAQETRSLKASFSDDDGKDDPSWQWSRCTSDDVADCTPIDGATSTDRTPSADDVDNWLRATVSYTDSFGATSASAAIGPVVGETLSNSAPSFAALDEDSITANVQVTRSVAENKKGALGEPITATDGEDDPRLYTLGGTDKDCFGIGNTSGQLSLNAERDYETPLAACKEGGTARTAATGFTAPTTQRQADNVYTVEVTATDPSGATGKAFVTVTVTDANEAAKFTDAASAATQKTLYIDENVSSTDSPALALRTGSASTAGAPVDYEATDEDRAADGTTTVDTVTYTLEGADAEHFTIGGTDGTEDTLGIATGEDKLGTDEANFEGKPSYSITIVATSTGSVDSDTDPATPVRGKRISTLDVTIKVVDGEDGGKVTFPTVREPQEGKPVLAKLADPDGGEVGVKWQWYRGDLVDTDAATAGDQLGCATAGQAADSGSTPGTDRDTTPTPGNFWGWQPISGATTALYTPGSDTFDHDGDAILAGAARPDATPEVAYCLRATATYTDDIVTDNDTLNADGTITAGTPDGNDDGDTAHGVTDRPVQEDDPANTAPEFNKDQDPSTPGNQAVAERSVAENAKGAKVGEPVVAADSDLLVYSISDTTNFAVDNDGQITTKVELDYEALPDDAKYHMVELTATDPSGAEDSVMVKINVTDEDDGAVITGVKTFSYDENGKDPVETFTANDPDADAGDIEWDLEGVDAPDFDIKGGVLTFKKSPNYEGATDRDEDPKTSVLEGAGDNKYQVTILASGGKLAVEVEVINIDEPGSVKFTQLQAQETRSLKASFSDDDGKDDPSWQWSRCTSDDVADCTPIDGATSTDRTPSADDVDNWLRATVSYTDSFGATSASAAIGPVVGETLSNSAPSFAALDEDSITANVQVTRSVAENKKGALGEPITATDGEDDPRLYTLGGTDKDCFGIGNTSGQLSLNAERDYETPLAACKEGGTARTAATGFTAPTTQRQADNVYTVEVTATDPSGATGKAFVTVTVTDANEAAKFTDAASAATQKTLYIDENVSSTDSPALALRTGSASTAGAPVDYEATDEDRAADGTTTVDTVTYTLEGADAEHFTIGGTDGTEDTLGIATGEDKLGTDEANFEGKPSYSITIVATSTGSVDSDTDPATPVRGKRISTLDVTIKVVDGEDGGKVTFPTVREPQEGKPVLAKLADPDGGEVGVKWQWYRGDLVDTDAATAGDQLGCATAGQAADSGSTPGTDRDTTPTPGNFWGWQPISGATTALYTPGSDTFDHDGDAILAGAARPDATPEVAYCLRATATYTDDIVTDNDTLNADGTITAGTPDGNDDGDTAHGVTDRPVQEDDPANTAPEFNKDQDPSTPGNQAVAERSVAENAKGAKVGEPVVAADSDLLVYSISDTTNFAVDNDGQITTKVELDYEALPDDAKYHMVELTATDPSGAEDSVMVKITVTDENDVPVISLAGGGPPEAMHPCVEGGAVAEDQSANLAADCQTLLDAKAELEGGGTELNWSADLEIAQWQGVAQRGTGRVGGVQLADSGLAGMVPASFNDLVGLQVLNLRDNDLTGGIPDLSALDNLEILNLKGNMLSGEIPATLADMDMLDYLWLYDNDLTGMIPAELGSVATLRQIRLHNNGLTGEIPSELGSIARLRYLTLSNNMLTGEIPAELGDATNLKALWLNSNMLTGMIPAELGSIMTAADDTLRLLYLSHNMLSGDVPSELGNLVSLTEGRGLRLSGNMLTGCIPAAIFGAASDADAAGLAACP